MSEEMVDEGGWAARFGGDILDVMGVCWSCDDDGTQKLW